MQKARTHRRPVVDQTITFLRALIEDRALKPGDAIPPARRLAAEAGVSVVSMCRALRELRERGALVLANKRTYAVGGNPVQSVPAPEKARIDCPPPIRPWQKVEEAIIGDIRDGVFRPGAKLPSTKVLEARYGVVYRTLRKALLHLARQKSIERTVIGGFTVPALQGTGWQQRIVCVTPSIDMRTMAFGHHDEALLRALEFCCEQARLKVDTLLLYYDPKYRLDRYRFRGTGEDMASWNLSTIGTDPVLGFVFFIPWELGIAYHRAVNSLLENRKPMVIVDETAQFRLPEESERSGRTRITTIGASQESGRIVARHLLSLGHRRVAFVSADHHFLWSRKRLEGLRDVFAEAGLPEGVAAFTAEGDATAGESADRGRAQLMESYGQWRAEVPADVRPEFAPSLAREASARVAWQRRIVSLVDKVAADPRISTMITVNDSTAAVAIARLRERGDSVPSDLSVVSFDDSVEALRCGVSSYNFNLPARAASVIGFMLGRKPFSEAEPEVAGFIVDRGTVGRPSTRGAAERGH